MQLYHRQYSQSGAPLVILHGLYGNHANWNWHARQLARDYAVYTFDARNHGQSPWADTMRFADMAADVAATMDALGLRTAHLLGHSMGGKTAMRLALEQPERVSSLVVVDIAPVDYGGKSDGVLEGLLAVEPGKLRSRSEADAILAGYIADKGVRAFLLTNLERAEGGGYRWRINLPVIAAYLAEVTDWRDTEGTYAGPVLFIKGEESSYILPEHRALTLRQFPQAELKVVENAGHWVHAEKPEAVLRLVRNFLITAAGNYARTAP